MPEVHLPTTLLVLLSPHTPLVDPHVSLNLLTTDCCCLDAKFVIEPLADPHVSLPYVATIGLEVVLRIKMSRFKN